MNYNQELKSRFLTLLWNVGGMLLAGVLDIVLQNLTSFNLPLWAVALLGMVIPQITKFIRNYNEKQIQIGD